MADMVDVIGHLGMALIWLAPSWYFFERKGAAAAFIAVSFWFGMLPDVDLYLSNWTQAISHHGVFHTFLAVTVFALVLGPVVGFVLQWIIDRTDTFSASARHSPLKLGIVGVWVAGTSHLFADMLSAPDVAPAIEPFWPLYNGQIVLFDVFWYKSIWATFGILAVGLGVNLAFWYVKSE